MKAKTLIIAAAAAVPVAAIRIDSSLVDGVYHVEPDAANPGGHIFRREASYAGSSLRRGEGEYQRPPAPYNCAPDNCDSPLTEVLPLTDGLTRCSPNLWARGFNSTFDYHVALNLLFESPLYWVPPKTARFALHRDVVVYVCNYGSWNSASLVEFMAAIAEVDARCGANSVGRRTMHDWGKSYGREARGWDICRGPPPSIGNRLGSKDGLETELWSKIDEGCETYVNGAHTWYSKGECRDGAAGRSLWRKLRGLFSWYDPLDRDETTNQEPEQ
ncbi:NAD-dependent histone deacetylase HST3 [Purpureocillium lavendulum]|uniref:NAD-dependent histone deacetylase HST3 n=1 Tax=Purpureocillium lavendulum TaxID=1247861 RepID=A0AB34FNV1_9HYPO|nr:NAD-dependent histone deacetylase HST3 [Purpureocillium lavendulum]